MKWVWFASIATMTRSAVRPWKGWTVEALRVLRVRGNSMEPEIREGDRFLVDTARRRTASGELFVLFDGTGLVVKRVEMVPGDERLRLLSANRASGRYTAPSDEVHGVGKVVWVLRRM